MARTDEDADEVRAKKERVPIPPVLWRRLGARFLDDWVVAAILIVLFTGPIGSSTDETWLSGLLLTTATFVGLIAYHTVMESTVGWTFGKRVLGLQVADLDGTVPSTAAALKRNLFYLSAYVPLLGRFVLIGAVLHLGRTARNDPDLRGAHDHWAGTVVSSTRNPSQNPA